MHAGVDGSQADVEDVPRALSQMSPGDLLWSRRRNGFASHLGVTVVYGHTPAEDFSVRWNDPELALPWPVADPILSDKDRDAPLLHDVRDRLLEYRAR